MVGRARRPARRGETSCTPSNHPGETVSWYEAIAFCRWLDARLRGRGGIPEGWEVRLPTEQEWEKAARGTHGQEFPWGQQFEPGYANIDGTQGHAGSHSLGQTTAVGSYPQGVSPYAAFDMAGNVWEWCLTKRIEPHDASVGGGDMRVLRGGSWTSLSD